MGHDSHMTTTKTSPELLAEAARRRRAELRLTQQQVADRMGMSLAVVALIERAQRQSYNVGTLAALDGALGWESGSAEAALHSGTPPVVVAGPTGVQRSGRVNPMLIDVPMEALGGLSVAELAEVEAAARMAALERARALRESQILKGGGVNDR